MAEVNGCATIQRQVMSVVTATQSHRFICTELTPVPPGAGDAMTPRPIKCELSVILSLIKIVLLYASAGSGGASSTNITVDDETSLKNRQQCQLVPWRPSLTVPRSP